MVKDEAPVGLDGVQVAFDDERVVSDAGLMLAATVAARLGIEALAQRLVRLRPKRPGAGNVGRKIMSLIYAMALGADSIDDCDVLRSGRTRRLLGGWVAAPSTLGTFLRAFTFGHVRQLDRLLAEALTRAWKAGAGPGDGRLTVDVDSFIGEVHGHDKQGAAFGYTRKRGYHPIVASRARDRRGSAHPAQEGLGQHLTRDAAFLRRADRARRARRRDRAQATARRLGLLVAQGVRAAGSRGLELLDRRAPAAARSRGNRADRRGRLADAGRLPADEHRPDRRDRARRPAPDRAPRPHAQRPGRAAAQLAVLPVRHQPRRRHRTSSRPSTASTPSSSSSSATSKTRRWRTSPPATSTPTRPGQ